MMIHKAINIAMKIQDLLEATTAPVYGYHSTFLSHLPSILKQGLMPNKSEGGYGSGDTSLAGYSLQSLPGVYFFKDGRDAEILVKDFNSMHGKAALVIVSKIQPKTATLDEDNLVSEVIDELHIIRKFNRSPKQDFDKDKFILNQYHRIVDNMVGEYDDRLIDNVKDDVYRYVHALVEFVLKKTPEGDEKVKKLQEVLSNKLRKLHFNKSHKSFKVDGPVTFSGSNRIVGVYSPEKRAGWGDLGYFERDAYHKYKTPLELYKSFSE